MRPLQLGDLVVICDFQDKIWSTEGAWLSKSCPTDPTWWSWEMAETSEEKESTWKEHLKNICNLLRTLMNFHLQRISLHQWKKTDKPATSQQRINAEVTKPPVTTRRGRVVKPPKYLQDYQQWNLHTYTFHTIKKLWSNSSTFLLWTWSWNFSKETHELWTWTLYSQILVWNSL